MGDRLLEHRATFKSMPEGTREDWEIIGTHHRPYARDLPERILGHLRLLGGDSGGFAVDRLQHSLLTASLAERGGEDEEYVVCALVHDIGDTLACWNHADLAAAVVKPFVSPANHWMVEKHAIFQGYHFFHHIGMDRNMRDQFRGHEHFDRTERFIDLYDAPAFDPDVDCLPLAHFEPMLRRVFAQPRNSIYRDSTAQK